jgi:hypothetical protein
MKNTREGNVGELTVLCMGGQRTEDREIRGKGDRIINERM